MLIITKEIKKPTVNRLLEEILSVTIKQNYAERIKTLEWEVNLWKGNHNELLKRVKAMEKKLGWEFVQEAKYKKIK